MNSRSLPATDNEREKNLALRGKRCDGGRQPYDHYLTLSGITNFI